jgi:hypothetical protein
MFFPYPVGPPSHGMLLAQHIRKWKLVLFTVHRRADEKRWAQAIKVSKNC